MNFKEKTIKPNPNQSGAGVEEKKEEYPHAFGCEKFDDGKCNCGYEMSIRDRIAEIVNTRGLTYLTGGNYLDELVAIFSQAVDSAKKEERGEVMLKIHRIREFGADFDRSIKVMLHKKYVQNLVDSRQQIPSEKEKYDFFRGIEYAMDFLKASLSAQDTDWEKVFETGDKIPKDVAEEIITTAQDTGEEND